MGLTSRFEVLTKLRNQTVKINGLHSIFAEWPFAVNPGVQQVRCDVDERLSRYMLPVVVQVSGFCRKLTLSSLFPKHPKLRKLKAGDYGLFGSTWWPRASVKRLRIATYLSIWVRWPSKVSSSCFG